MNTDIVKLSEEGPEFTFVCLTMGGVPDLHECRIALVLLTSGTFRSSCADITRPKKPIGKCVESFVYYAAMMKLDLY